MAELTTETKEIQVRKLNTKDFWNILNIVRKGGKAAFDQLKNADIEKGDELAAGLLIVDIGMEYAQEELSKFFADIAGMEPNEYEESGFDTTLVILEQIQEKEDLVGFFSRAASFVTSFLKKKQ